MIEAVNTRARGLRPHRAESRRGRLRRPPARLAPARRRSARSLGYGLWAIGGITAHDIPGNPNYFVMRQSVYAAIGCIGLVAALFVDPDYYRRFRQPIFIGTAGVMLLVLLVGTVSRHSKRWLDIGFFRFQPSEFGKLLFVLFLAGFLADRARRIGETRTVLEAIGLGWSRCCSSSSSRTSARRWSTPPRSPRCCSSRACAGCTWPCSASATVVLALAVLWLLPAAGVHVLKPYQEQRLTHFTHPDRDPAGATYNVRQSINAVGAGGVKGRGEAGATQTNLNFLPEHATDFAFASLAEQRGFVGVSVLLLLYLLVVWRGLKVIAIARDAFSAIAAGGIVFAFLFQVFVNVGMNIGIAPVTGIPLPFVSVGGSALIANLLAIGVLQAIHVRGAARPKAYR